MEEEEEGGVFAEWGKAGFNVFPFCKMKPVDSQQPQTWILEIYSCDKSCSVKTVTERAKSEHVNECANRNRSFSGHK